MLKISNNIKAYKILSIYLLALFASLGCTGGNKSERNNENEHVDEIPSINRPLNSDNIFDLKGLRANSEERLLGVPLLNRNISLRARTAYAISGLENPELPRDCIAWFLCITTHNCLHYTTRCNRAVAGEPCTIE
ncbi:hypothetical protein M2451_002362 [Dysgonomonas sp. PFB1-18]|nr:hypothetical protein [Dysgonomonas sp. PF1-14]MDH6337047.1 hypothetical protein [Dysgonomonas sp. PF1-16]MDH6381033.1 hypothetical protein [Dysgonomonas sp. PFB1-18]MDH6396388.1 hypothetical protein [Dysgonomonas sp. PF1-23]